MYLGLTIGLIFFVIAVSGAIYAWEPEISTVIYKQQVQKRNQPFAKVSILKANLAKEFPEGDFRGVLFQGKSNTANVLLFVPGTYYYAFMDPYTGEVNHLQNMKKGGLNQLKLLHRNLLLGDIGKNVVHWVTLLALIMVLSGIVLWWPSRKSRRKYHFIIKWKSRPLKLNYDLHNVLGFYASWIGVFIILTGIFWGFESFRNLLKKATAENDITYELPLSDVSGSSEIHNLDGKVDSLAFSYLQDNPNKSMRISYPHKASDPIEMTVVDAKRRVHRTNIFYFDQYTGQRLSGKFEYGVQSDASPFKTINGLVYDIHLGNLGGFWGRLLVSFTSLVMASLPITGFVIWYSKR